MSMTTTTNHNHTHRAGRAATAIVATLLGIAALTNIGTTSANASTNHRPCGHGIDTSIAPVIRWGWQYNDVHYVETPLGDVGVWTNRHGRIIGYSAHEDTNIMRTAMCAARDL